MRQSAAAHVGNGMAGSAGVGKLGNDVEEIAGGYRSHRQIAKDWIRNFPRAGAMAAQAIFILIHGGIHGRHAIRSVDADNAVL